MITCKIKRFERFRCTVIIIGEIVGFDIGDKDALVHVLDEHGTWHRCIADAKHYGPAIRFLAKNKDRIKITGNVRQREIYHTPGVQQEVLIISFLEQLHEACEDFNFRLTGAL